MLLFSVGLVSCTDDDNDTLTGSENTGGLLNTITSGVTYAQGSAPTDEMTAKFRGFQGNDQIVAVEVYKQFTGQDADGELATSNSALLTTVTMPNEAQMEFLEFNFTYEQLISGLTFEGAPLPADDSSLHIGDFWTLTYVSVLANGERHVNRPTTKVTVSCGSFLAGTYDLIVTRVGTTTTYALPDEVITEIGDGTYYTSSTGPYNNRGAVSAGAQIPSPTPGFIFTDVCGALALQPNQTLGNYYSNAVYQTPDQAALSSADPVTGVLTIHYSIYFAAGDRQYIGVYTPQ